ncbi:hypothetical protein B0H14DRAFT_2729004 [Mycena olivaceomarginata]|nr:hypothetical protein B0H14DRAFT_2729004 [Mycena olivaceomarginata]
MKNHIVQVVDRARQGFKRTRSGSISASQVVLVPPELWLQIFSYLTTSGDLKAVSLTCTCFRQLAQPLLFSKISTHPAPPPLALRGIQTSKYRRRTSQRLEFFLSPLIAPAVRECWIHPPSAEDDDLPTDVLIDAIFDGLRKLPNLKVLGCQSIRLTPKRLAVLHGLALMTVTLESCPSDVVDFTHQPVLPLCSVTFKYHDPPSRDVFLAPLLSLFLAPRHLQRLSATTPEILLALTLRRPFARLTHLDLPVDCLSPTNADSLVAALSHTPALERITLHTDPDGGGRPYPRAPALPPLLLPHLKAYRGPRNYAALFAGTGRLSTVELSLPAKAHRLLRTFGQIQAQVQFQQSHTPVELDFLSFRVDGHVPPGFLQNVHTLLPALRTLSINDPAVAPASLQALLAETSPCPNIRMFRIRVEGRDRYNLWVPPVEEAVDAVECFNKVRAEIDRVYPSLWALKLLYGVEGGAVVWKRDTVTGQLVQVTVL